MKAAHTSLPDGFRLLEGEHLSTATLHDLRTPIRPPSGLRELYRLTRASRYSEVGEYGPVIAAIALEGTTTPDHQGLFGVVFGRDALRVALELVTQHPLLAQSTLRRLAETQGVTYDTSREEEPGRIAHEIRDPTDPIAERLTAERGWGWPYYGSVDATPQFIRTLAAYCQTNDPTGRLLSVAYIDRTGTQRTLASALIAAVNWLRTRLDASPLGVLEYKSTLPHGIENQVWKDSWDAYHHADGHLANHSQGIAALEVQTVTHDALLDAADLYERLLNRPHEAHELQERAAYLSETILTKFWTEEKGGYFVLGLDYGHDGTPRQLRIRTSNMGHVLNSRVIDGDDPEKAHKRAAIFRQLNSPELLSISGIRTLASDETRYREGAYHNGSVWIWDTHHIAKGARRHATEPAFAAFAQELDRRILRVVDAIGSFPEYVRGGDSIAINTHTIDVEDTMYHRINRVEQPPQEVQAWTVAAILTTKYRNRRASRLVQG